LIKQGLQDALFFKTTPITATNISHI